jgi:membrane fusion protein, epimerase transport system
MNPLAQALAQAPGVAPSSLAACLHHAGGTPSVLSAPAAPRLLRQLAGPALACASLLALWVATAPLQGAVVANGQVQTELGRKTVQHQEGGLLQELRVRPGQAVRRGDVLLVLSDLRTDAAVALLQRQQAAERLRLARATAEVALKPRVSWPADLPGGDPQALAREQQLFDARRLALNERLQALNERMAQVRARSAALAEATATARQSAELSRSELDMNRELVSAGFIQKARLLALERQAADSDGRVAATRSQEADVRAQLAALAEAAAQARSDHRQRAADELKEAGVRLEELQQRLRPGQDQVERLSVRAPVDGVVMSLRVSASGTAVGPREPLLDIAPSAEGLLVDAWIEPRDIDHVRAGGAAELRLGAFDSRSLPMLAASVQRVAPDVSQETADRLPRYRVQVAVSAAELARLPGVQLQAGMPVEVFIATPARTLWQYLAQPLGVFARRAMREP